LANTKLGRLTLYGVFSLGGLTELFMIAASAGEAVFSRGA
jgi:hypothetical protein